MRHLPRIIFSTIFTAFYFFLANINEADASVLASQTQSYADLGSTWAFSQDLGNNLSGAANSITVRLTTSSTIDGLGPNSSLIDKTNNFQMATHGCVGPTEDPHNLLKGLTIATGGSVPPGYQDVTIDLRCGNYSFIQGHSYMFVFTNANSYSIMTFAAHRGSHSDHQDFYPGGGIYYGASGYNVINCFSLVGAFSIVDYVQNCYSWDDDRQNSSVSTDDLYFILNGTPPPPPQLPVIFIPGIGGAELTTSSDTFLSVDNGHGGVFSHGYNSGEKVWVNNTEAAKLGEDDYFDVLKLKADGQTPEALLGLNGSLNPFGYGEVDSFFQNLGYQKGTNYFTFPYDWRFDVKNTAQALDTLVEHAKQTSGQSKVIIVAHSLGGLVGRNYISDSTKAAKVDKLIEMGVPHLGAVDSLKGLVYGKSVNFTYKMLNIPIIPSSEIKDVYQNLTSGFELLPTSQYFNFYTNSNDLLPYPYFDDRDIDNNGVSGPLGYSQIKTLLSNLNFNMAVFNLSEAFHHTLDPSFTQANGVKLYEIVGTGIPTLGQIKETWWIGWPMNLIPKKDEYFINGDDTVPLYSASLKSQSVDFSGGAKIYYLDSQRHEDLTKASGLAMQTVQKILAEDTTLVENQKTTLEGTQISLDGSDIDLYDNSGNHTGLKSDGSIEENIPGTFYSGSENTKHIFIKKTTPPVKVKVKPATITTTNSIPKKVTLRTRTYTQDSVQSTTVYPPIAVTDTSEIDFNLDPQNTPSPTLTSYPDSTSANSTTGGTTISPSSQITDNSVLDQIPPITTASVSGTLNGSGSYIGSATITLASADSGSGVFQTDYSLDSGQTTQTYTSPFTITTSGTTTLKTFSTDKVGNQEIPKTISITILASAPQTSSTNNSGGSSAQITNVLGVSAQNIPSNPKAIEELVREVKAIKNPQDKPKDILGVKTFDLIKPGRSKGKNTGFSLKDILTAMGAGVGILSITFGLSFLGNPSYLNLFKKPPVK